MKDISPPGCVRHVRNLPIPRGSRGDPRIVSARVAVRHARRDKIARLLIEVWDAVPAVPGAPVPKETSEYDESGRGLSIVETLSEQWGWKPVPGWPGKVTWPLLRVIP